MSASSAQQRFDQTINRFDALLDQRVREDEAKLEREDAERRAAKRALVRADDMKCRDLAAEYQPDYGAFGFEPPMMRSDEWSGDYQLRLLRGLQRKLSPGSDLADPKLLDSLPANAVANFAAMIRSEATKEAATPSYANLPDSVHDPAAKLERQDTATGARTVEFRAKRSFIADMSPPRVRAFIADPRTLRGRSMINRDVSITKHPF